MYVLLVEDEVQVGNLWKPRLERAGYSVEWVTSLAAAIASVVQRAFDVVVLDLKLPDGHGLELVRFARERNLALNALVVTSESRATVAHQVGLLGVEWFLQKPIPPSELIAAVQAAAAAAAAELTIAAAIRSVTAWSREAPDLRRRAYRLYRDIAVASDVSLYQFDLVAAALREVNEDSAAVTVESTMDRLSALERRAQISDELGRVLDVISRTRFIRGEDIARACSISRRRLAEVFESTDRDVRQWARLARVRRGLAELCERGRTPSQAAYEVGYSTVQQFDRDCQREFAGSPSQFLFDRPSGDSIANQS